MWFGVVTDFLANKFVSGPDAKAKNPQSPPSPNDLDAILAEIKTLRAEQSRSYDELESKIEGLKSLLGENG